MSDDKFKQEPTPEKLKAENKSLALELAFVVRKLDTARNLTRAACMICREEQTVCDPKCPLYKVSTVLL